MNDFLTLNGKQCKLDIFAPELIKGLDGNLYAMGYVWIDGKAEVIKLTVTTVKED